MNEPKPYDLNESPQQAKHEPTPYNQFGDLPQVDNADRVYLAYNNRIHTTPILHQPRLASCIGQNAKQRPARDFQEP